MSFHVFLSHGSTDKPAVEELARRLAKEGIQAWLDKWHLIPGNPWQPDIEKALADSATCAVFVGPSGFGPWQNEEMRADIDQRVRDSGRRFRVIPVLLPGAKRAEQSSLPTFLAATTWVEYPDSLDDPTAFHRLVCGIRGLEPGAGPGQAIYEGQCPYRGLRVFDVGDVAFFFGREALVQWLLNELRPATEGQLVNRFLAIVGASGSGKSSVARAGLVAALNHDVIPGSSRWPIVICRPGPDPIESLASDQTVKLWKSATGTLLSTLQGHTAAVYSVAWNPDGKILASGSLDQTVKLWEAVTSTLLASLQGHTAAVYSVAWSSDGKTLASGSLDQTVKLWEAATGKLLASLQGHTAAVYSVAWNPDGKILASGSGDQTVKLWEAATGKLLSTLQGHTAAVYSVAWSPDGKILASGSGDQTVKLWEAATGKLLSTLQGNTGQVWSVAWSPDGKTLASGSSDQTVRLWDTATGKLLATLQGHTDVVYSVTWSPDGKTLASGSSDQTVELWEAATGKLLASFQGHTAAVKSVTWSPDGKTLASGSLDQTVKLWEVPSTFEIDLAEYLRSRRIRLDRSEIVWEVNENLLRDRSFDVVNLSRTTLLGIEGSSSFASQKLGEELNLLLRAGNFPEAIAIWKAASTEAVDSPIRRMLLAALSAAASELFLNTSWRGLWLTEQMQSLITSEAMLDPAVSLGMLRLGTQLALAGSDERKVVSVRESFNARIASMAPRTWFVALGQNLLTAATETDSTKKERQAAVEQLRRLTNQLPDSAELRQMLADALHELH